MLTFKQIMTHGLLALRFYFDVLTYLFFFLQNCPSWRGRKKVTYLISRIVILRNVFLYRKNTWGQNMISLILYEDLFLLFTHSLTWQSRFNFRYQHSLLKSTVVLICEIAESIYEIAIFYIPKLCTSFGGSF